MVCIGTKYDVRIDEGELVQRTQSDGQYDSAPAIRRMSHSEQLASLNPDESYGFTQGPTSKVFLGFARLDVGYPHRFNPCKLHI